MVTRGGHEYDIPPKFLQIKQEGKFFSRLLSKESSKGEASFRVLYYGGASGAIPFMWESRPGTPKHTFSDTSLPPLTPPPSYQMSPRTLNSMQKQSKPKFLHSIFLRMAWKKSSESASFSSSSFSSSYSLPSTPMNSFTSRRKFVRRSRSAVPFGLDEDLEDVPAAISPTSTLCFGGGNRCSPGKVRSYYGMKNVKKALLSIVGHDTAKKCN